VRRGARRIGGLLLIGAVLTIGAVPSSGGVRTGRRLSSQFLVTVTPFTHRQLSQRATVELVSRSGTVQRVVAPAGAPYPYEALWSPDDSLIAWAARDGIHVESADGSTARLLLVASTTCTGSCTILHFVWSPDSRSLAVGGAGPQTNEFLLVPVDGTATQTIEPTLPSVSYSPSFWTTDGGSLVFSSFSGRVGTASCCHADLAVTTPSTGKTRTVYTTRNWHDTTLPLLSADLRYRAVISEVSQYRQQLRLTDASTGKSHVVAGVNPTNFAEWSPNSPRLAVVETGWHVVSVDGATGRVAQIGRGLNVYWSRDGELLVVRGRAYDQVWSSTGGRAERMLFTSPQGQYVLTIDGN
jgi:hypothetical protein